MVVVVVVVVVDMVEGAEADMVVEDVSYNRESDCL